MEFEVEYTLPTFEMLGYRLEYAEQLKKGEAPFRCLKCLRPLPIRALSYQASTGETKLYCLHCKEAFKISFEEAKDALAKLLRKKRIEFKDLNCNVDVNYNENKVQVYVKRFGCPNCGITNDEAEYHKLFHREGWLDNQCRFRIGVPIIWNVMPNMAACRNCGHEFKVEEDITLTLSGTVNSQNEIRMNCPNCGYAWVNVEGHPLTYRKILKFRNVGLLGFKCLACGSEIYYRILEAETPLWEPFARKPKHLKGMRLFKSLKTYYAKLKQSVRGSELQNLLKSEKLSLTRSHERAALDFENRVQPVLKLVVEKMFEGSKQILLEDVLRFSHYIWVNCNKAGRIPAYIILGILHYAYAVQVLLTRRKALNDSELDATCVGRAFPLQKCWSLLEPNRKFQVQTYEKNLNWLLEQLGVAHWKHPLAFKRYMMMLVEQ